MFCRRSLRLELSDFFILTRRVSLLSIRYKSSKVRVIVSCSELVSIKPRGRFNISVLLKSRIQAFRILDINIMAKGYRQCKSSRRVAKEQSLDHKTYFLEQRVCIALSRSSGTGTVCAISDIMRLSSMGSPWSREAVRAYEYRYW